MARGRGGSVDSSSLIISRRRDISPYFEPLDVGRKAYRLSHSVDIDADDLSKKSRDRDRKLLKDITQRLVTNNYMDYATADALMDKPSLHSSRPTYSTRYPGSNDLPMSALFIRASSLPPRRKKRDFIDFYDYEFEPDTKPKKRMDDVYFDDYKIRKPIRRATAPRVIYVPSNEPISHYRPPVKSDPHYRPPVHSAPIYRPPMHSAPLYCPPRAVPLSTPKRVELMVDDYVVPEFTPYVFTHSVPVHTAESYRFASRAYSEPPYRRSSAPHIYRRVVTPHAMLAVANARQSLYRVERELGLEPSFDEPVVIHRQSRPVVRASPAPIRRNVATSVHSTPRLRVRSSSVPASPRVVPRNRARLAEIEGIYSDYEPDWSYVPVRPYAPANISHTCSKARRPRSTSATRVRPVVVASSFEPSLPPRPLPRKRRMPELDPYRPHMGLIGTADTSKVEPYKPANLSKSGPVKLGPSPRGNFRPQVSETRRRIRDVICTTRKDPHYFD